MGRDSIQEAGPNRPLSRIRARSSQRAPAPAPSSPAPAQGSAISPAAAAAASPTALSRKAGRGEAGVDRFPRSPGSLSGHPWTLGRAPARRCRSLRAGVPRSCAPLSGTGSDPFAASASSPGCQGLGAGRKLVERGGPPPACRAPPLAFPGSGPGWSASPPLGPPHSGPPCLACAPNCKEASGPRAAAPNPAGAAQDAARTAGREGVGKAGRREVAPLGSTHPPLPGALQFRPGGGGDGSSPSLWGG